MEMVNPRDTTLVEARSKMKKFVKGFTLVEMMLVLVIISSILGMLVNYTQLQTQRIIRNKAAIQIQQILNAALAYYINTGYWPNYNSTTYTCPSSTLATLIPNYLPTTNNPYISMGAYSIACTASGILFTVSLPTSSSAEASVLAGMLPMGSYSSATVTASVNVPGQNLNNARSVNQAGVYHNGACVPVPTCPGATSGATMMTPSIYVAVEQILGANDYASGNPRVYPITGFTAYAKGGYDSSPPQCPPNTGTTGCSSPNGVAGQKYWRVCVDVTTLEGDVGTNSSGTGGTGPNGFGPYQTILAMTRCVPSSSNEGDPLSVYYP
jgi:prepilin-type N-terminal cleavage/methylation domain-containing protein